MPPVSDENAVSITAETDIVNNNKKKKKKKDDNNKNNNNNNKTKSSSTTSTGGDEKKDDTMSEEDRELKERLDTCVSTLLNKNLETNVTIPLRHQALNMIINELRSATSSMTSVPKPLKFLRPHYNDLVMFHNSIEPNSSVEKDGGGGDGNDGNGDVEELLLLRARLADVLAVLAMTMGKQDERESLKLKLSGMKDYETLKSRGGGGGGGGGTPSETEEKEKKLKKEEEEAEDDDNLGSWGHEFVRSLAGEIGQEYNARVLSGKDPESDEPFHDLLSMVDVIVPFHVTHNAEAEAVDLLIEVQRLKKLLDLTLGNNCIIDGNNYERICLYLVKTADFMSDPDDLNEMLDTAIAIFRNQNQYYDALRVALRRGIDSSSSNEGGGGGGGSSSEIISDLMSECTSSGDLSMKKQMCLLLARHGCNYDYEEDGDEDDNADVYNELLGNAFLSEQFIKVAQDLDVMDAKTPEDIYKSHLAETGGFSRRREGGGGGAGASSGGAQVDSARANLASTFVNAFVNAGFGQDKLMTPDNEWLYKNKDHGMLSAAASLGLILLWNVEEGLTQIDKFLYSSEDYVKAGAALAVGILSCGVRNDADPALALLAEHAEGNVHVMKCAACTGLGIAYAGSGREEVMELLVPILESSSSSSSEGGGGGGGGDTNTTMLEVSLAGLALGMIYVGRCDETVGSAMVQRLMEASDDELNHSHAKFLCLGLGLLFLGRTENADAMLEAVRTVEHTSISKYASVVLQTCAYAGSGNVLQVQEMLHQCAEHLTEDANHQMAAVIGIGLLSMNESVGSEMALRTFEHLLHYCELPIKRAVPLSLGILFVSNPDFSVVDQLSRLTHDPDNEISQNAILALGIIGAGTNNSRIAGLLRQLSEFYSKDAGHVFCVRIAQGLLHLGKGLLTLSPIHSDRMLTSGPALGALLIVLHSCLDLKSTLLDKTHYLLYYLTCGMNPRMLITVTDDSESESGGGAGAGGELEWKPITARVGQAVETVGQAGKPKTITGFQTHTTPVLLGTTERAELGTEEYLSVSSVLEGIVIVKENPDYEPEEGK